MKLTLRIIPITLICLFNISVSIGADMVLTTERGVDIILHDDGKWEFAKSTSPALKEDIKVTLADDRVVLVTTNGEWGFADKEMTKYDDIRLDSVSVSAAAKSIDVLKAQEDAGNKALDKLAQKLQRSIHNRKLPTQKLKQCIREVEKGFDSSEDFTEGKGWDVTVELKLDRGSILAVVDCVLDTASSAPPPPAVPAPEEKEDGEAMDNSTPLPPQPGD